MMRAKGDATRVWRQLLWLFALLSALVFARAALAVAPAAEPTATVFKVEPVDDAWRAALPRDPDAATRAYLARLPAETRARSDAYFEGGYVLHAADLALGLAIAALLMGAGLSLRMRGLSQRWLRRRFLQDTVYAVLYIVAVWLISLPLTIYAGFVREHAYGMATQGFGAWFGEHLMAFGISVVLGAPFIALLLLIVRRFERSWWVWGAVASSLLVAVMATLGPVYIDPLFNTYRPLAESPLQQRILTLARSNGVPVDNVMRFDASRQTTRVSANVSGLFGTAAVRLNDNLLERCSDAEIVAVVGHEVGHYVMNHIPKSILQFGLLIAAVFALTAWLARRLLQRFGARWGVASLGDAAALPALAAVMSVVLFVATPITNTIVREQEIEADLFGLNLAREPDGEAEVLLKLVEYRKADPGPIEEWVFFDHPSTYRRIYNAMRWKAQMQAPAQR
jgi:STE24 endopeptidase